MSDTQVLLGKIAMLRQRLEQSQGLAGDVAGTHASPAHRLERLQQQLEAGAEHDEALDATVRPIAPSAGTGPMPQQLTARARRVLERGRDMLHRLRTLGEELDRLDALELNENEPLRTLYRESAAMVDSSLRWIQTFPDSPSAQLRLCSGLEASLELLDERLRRLAVIVEHRQLEFGRVARLTELLTSLERGSAPDLQLFVAMAEEIVQEAEENHPLRFLSGPAGRIAQFVACHSLTVAQVVARVARHDPEMRGRLLEPVLAALLHDVGMLRIPGELLLQTGPLEDSQRRLVESHCRVGSELVSSMLPGRTWLAEAACGHHERLDGTGYPDGLQDCRISPLNRLLAVCDLYAALCSSRPHRPARDPRSALADTLLLAEQGWLDRHHAERLLTLSFYPIGSVVELADGAVAGVVAVHAGKSDLALPARPVVALLTDCQGRPLPMPVHLDLAQVESRSVIRTLTPVERRSLLGRHHPEWA